MTAASAVSTGSPPPPRIAPRDALLAFAALVAVAGGALLGFPGSQDLFWAKLMDAGHLPAFALLTLALYRTASSMRGPRAALVLAIFPSVVVALAIELIQPAFGRDADPRDLWWDGIGIALAIAWIELRRRRVAAFSRLLFAAAAAFTLVVAVLPALEEWAALMWRARHFPLLADFEEPGETPLWSTRDRGTELLVTQADASTGDHSLRVRVAAGLRGGLSLDAGGLDWSGYDALALDIFNPGDRFRLAILGIDDSRRADLDGRFTGRYAIEPGWNRLRIPIAAMRDGPRDRKLNVGAMQRLHLVVAATSEERVFLLDHVRLESRATD